MRPHCTDTEYEATLSDDEVNADMEMKRAFWEIRYRWRKAKERGNTLTLAVQENCESISLESGDNNAPSVSVEIH